MYIFIINETIKCWVLNICLIHIYMTYILLNENPCYNKVVRSSRENICIQNTNWLRRQIYIIFEKRFMLTLIKPVLSLFQAKRIRFGLSDNGCSQIFHWNIGSMLKVITNSRIEEYGVKKWKILTSSLRWQRTSSSKSQLNTYSHYISPTHTHACYTNKRYEKSFLAYSSKKFSIIFVFLPSFTNETPKKFA